METYCHPVALNRRKEAVYILLPAEEDTYDTVCFFLLVAILFVFSTFVINVLKRTPPFPPPPPLKKQF